MKTEQQVNFKRKHGRYCCDVADCRNFAHAEMYRTGKNHGWCFVCHKHYQSKLRPATKKDMKERNIFRGKVPLEDNIGFCIMTKRINPVDFLKPDLNIETSKVREAFNSIKESKPQTKKKRKHKWMRKR